MMSADASALRMAIRFARDGVRFVPDVCESCVIALDDEETWYQVTPPDAGGWQHALLVSPGYEMARRDVASPMPELLIINDGERS